MRIAVVADIHGNVRALRAVMDDLKDVAADRVINLGDCVSGPLEAAETADLLISLAWTTVRGNHDRQLLDRPADQMGQSDQAALAELKNHHKGWLSSLEESVEFEGLLFCPACRCRSCCAGTATWCAVSRSITTGWWSIRAASACPPTPTASR